MRKAFVIITFTLSVIFLALLVGCVAAGVDEYHYLQSTPNTSGIDYLTLAFTKGICCVLSFVGTFFSCISLYLSKNKVIKIMSLVLLGGFIVAFVACGIAF